MTFTRCKHSLCHRIMFFMMKPSIEQIETLQSAISRLIRRVKVSDGLPTAGMPKLIESETQALLFIFEHPKCIAMDLSTFLQVVPTTATAIVDRLVQKQLVCRTRTEKNRRIVQLELTEVGAGIVDAIIKEQQKLCISILEKLDKNEREQFILMMKKVSD